MFECYFIIICFPCMGKDRITWNVYDQVLSEAQLPSLPNFERRNVGELERL